MRRGNLKVTVIALLVLGFGTLARGDSYTTFQTKQFYSSNHQYFVEITPSKRATLYRKGRGLKPLWTSVLPELPGPVFVANDGERVIMIDRYYGNNSEASANVVLFFDQTGAQIASHQLGQVANLSRVLHTTSSAHWYYGASFTPDGSTFVVETVVMTCDPQKTTIKTGEDIAAREKCMKAQPFEELHFSIETGALVSRVDIQTKYEDPEKRLLHELMLVESLNPKDNLSLVYSLLDLARFYEQQERFATAKLYYEKAIPIYSKALSPDYFGVAGAIGKAATNCRKMGDYVCAEKLYKRALTSLDEKQGNPGNVSPLAITVYEDYAVLLRMQKRDQEAERMVRRATMLRAANPNYNPQ